MGEARRRWLYRTEAKSIQSWILSTDRLRELKGGSSIIESLTEEARRRLEGRWFYAAAGGVTARFETTDELRAFAADWPMWVAQRAPGLEIVQAWVEERPGADVLQELHIRLQEARQRRWPDLPEAGPWIARAGRSGLPAVTRDRDGGLLDEGTRARQDAGLNDALGRQLLGDEAVNGRTFEDELLRYPSDEGIGIVHADGNAIGERVRRMDPDALRAFAERMSNASLQAARMAVTSWAREDGEPSLFGRPIVAGGDDFTFLVRGTAAIPLAVAWLRAFEHQTGDLSACAGVVLVRRGFPFGRGHELAERLCKVAKAHYRARGDGCSRLAFHRTTSSGADPSDTVHSWSLDEVERLDRLASEADRLGVRGKLRGWLERTPHDPERAADLWARTREVADEGWDDFASALRNAGLDPDEGGPAAIPWIRAVLHWSRIQPSLLGTRLWRDA